VYANAPEPEADCVLAANDPIFNYLGLKQIGASCLGLWSPVEPGSTEQLHFVYRHMESIYDIRVRK
jgi:hypothetical protein